VKSVELVASNSSACEGIIPFDYFSYVQFSTGRIVKNFSRLNREGQFFIVGYSLISTNGIFGMTPAANADRSTSR
jgi:hypothetical protein